MHPADDPARWLLKRLRDGTPTEQATAVLELARLDPDRDPADVIAALGMQQGDVIRGGATVLVRTNLIFLRQVRPISLLGHCLRGHPDASERAMAAMVLGTLREVCEAAGIVADDDADRHAVAALAGGVSDPSSAVRAEVARALGRLRVPAGSPLLIQLREDRARSVRRAARRALSRLPD